MEANKLWISETICEKINSEAERYVPLETGGVIMGYQATNKEYVVTDIIDAGPNAIRSRYKFIPDQEYQLAKIASIYMLSEGDITYLGDWHTHPEGRADLSVLDKKTLTKIALTPQSNNATPIMVVVGKYPEKWSWNAVKFLSGKIYPWLFFKCNYKQLDIVRY